jgi:hypothetical protein
MTTKNLLLIALSLIVTGQTLGLTVPDDGFVSGWNKPVKPLTYNRESLSDYIDGDAELFNELGFRQLQVQQYQNGAAEIDLEAYEFDNPNGALAIYLLRCGKETPSREITARNSAGQTQIMAVKGNCFIQVINYTESDASAPVMVTLAQQSLANVTITDTTTVFDRLPSEQMQAGSERVFCGPLSLQAMYRLGKGDLLQLQGKVFGAAAKYAESDRSNYTLAVVPYADAAGAAAAFANVQKGIDPGLQVFGKTATGFAFKDRQNKYGQIELKESVIQLKLNLVRKPSVASK